MKLIKLLLIPLVFTAFVLSGCDESNSNAQEPMPDGISCPCYSKEDVINELKQAGGSVNCAVESLDGDTGFTLDPGGPLGGLISTACGPNSSNCTCLIGDDLMENLNFLEASDCLTNMVGAIVEFDNEGLSFSGCTLSNGP